MVNTDEIQVGSRSLVRRQDDIKRSVLFYTLRRFNKSQRQGGPGRQKGEDRGTPVGVSRDTGGTQGGPTPAGFPGPVILDNLGRVVALLQSVFGELSAAHREWSLGELLDRLAAESQSESQRRWRLLLSARDVRLHVRPYHVAPQFSEPGGGELFMQRRLMDEFFLFVRSRRSSA